MKIKITLIILCEQLNLSDKKINLFFYNKNYLKNYLINMDLKVNKYID